MSGTGWLVSGAVVLALIVVAMLIEAAIGAIEVRREGRRRRASKPRF